MLPARQVGIKAEKAVPFNAKSYMKMPVMARKVKKICPIWSLDTEESLQTLSLQCEPATNTHEFLLKVAAGPCWNADRFPVPAQQGSVQGHV